MTVYYQTECPHFQMIQERLNQQGVKFEAVNLVDEVPSEKELGKLLMAKGWNARDIFNFNSPVYRRLELEDVIHDLNIEEIFQLLQSNGRLVASPLVVADSGCFAPVETVADLEGVLGTEPLAA